MEMDQSLGWSSVEEWTDTLRKFRQDANSRRAQKPRLNRTQVLAPRCRLRMWLLQPCQKVKAPVTRSSETSNSETTSDTSHAQDNVPYLRKKLRVSANIIPKAERTSCKGSSDERNPNQSCPNENSSEIFAVPKGDFCKSSSRSTSGHPD